MADNVTNELLLEALKRIQGTLGAMAADVTDLKTRMSAVEMNLGLMKQEMGQQSVQIAALNVRMDRFDERLRRIENRLDLADA